MIPSVYTIDRSHIQRSFIGTQDMTAPAKEAWEEAGNYYQGFELLVKHLMEQDSLARAGATLPGYADLGYLISGSCEPAQNDDEAIRYMQTKMNGTRNVALFTQWTPTSQYARLVLFRIQSLGNGKYSDNRFSMITSLHYTAKWKWQTDFSGWIPAYETYTVIASSVKVTNGRLLFTQAGIPPNSIPTNIT